jgi:signal transduction histidine kinase
MLSTAPESHCFDPRHEVMAELGEIASRMAHEIRNPLNAIRMQVAVIRNKIARPDPENLRVATSQLARLDQEVLRVEKLAKAFLEFGRPPADEPEDIDVIELAEDVAALVRPEFEELGVKFVFQCPAGDGLSRVYADRAKLRQMLINLLVNARNAMGDSGQVTLAVSRWGDREVMIQVRDTGCGIPPEIMPHIFLPFFSGRGSGAGLGLAIARKIVESAGGCIKVESKLDEGSCFRVILPVKSET